MQEYRQCCKLWRNWYEQAPAEIKERLPAFEAMSSYHSVKMEYDDLNYLAATKLWESSVVSGYNGDVNAVIALNNHKVALSLCSECLKGGEELSVDLLCGMQHALSCGLYTPEEYTLREERPGEFRQTAGAVSIIAVEDPAAEVEGAVAALINEMPKVAEANEPIVAAAYLHARLMEIRPFALANGFVSRLVTNYWLLSVGHPPLFIPSSEVSRYQLCLEQFDFHEDIEPLVRLFTEQVVAYWGPQILNVQQKEEEQTRKSVFTFKLT